MKTRGIIGITSLVLTLFIVIPVLFFLSKGAVSANRFAVIVAGVLFLVLWTISYVTLVDPLLRRGVGALLSVTIEWRGISNHVSWTPLEKTGCLAGLFIDLLGYFFLLLWFVPPAAMVVLALWFGH